VPILPQTLLLGGELGLPGPEAGIDRGDELVDSGGHVELALEELDHPSFSEVAGNEQVVPARR
jgi:hypothetical protein